MPMLDGQNDFIPCSHSGTQVDGIAATFNSSFMVVLSMPLLEGERA